MARISQSEIDQLREVYALVDELHARTEKMKSSIQMTLASLEGATRDTAPQPDPRPRHSRGVRPASRGDARSPEEPA